MQYLYLVRHGESIQNTGENEKLRIPDHAIPLTDKGRQQAGIAGDYLSKILAGVSMEDIVMWVSPYKRTRETAECILQKIKPIRVEEDDLLTELQFGTFDSVPKQQIPDRFPEEWDRYRSSRLFSGKFYTRFPGGESPLDCEVRQRLFLNSLFQDIRDNGPNHIIIVGHGAALTTLRKAIFRYSHEWYEKEPNPGNCSIQSIVLDQRQNIDKGYLYGGPSPKH